MRLIAVGDRQPSWVDSAVADYRRRLPRQWRFRVDPLPLARRSARRSASGRAASAVEQEGENILGRLRRDDFLVVLDESGKQFTSAELAERLGDWQQAGRDVAFVIGGPDGVSDACLRRADLRWSLSQLTLPHGLARITLVEQLYRAWSLLAGHPYHRS